MPVNQRKPPRFDSRVAPLDSAAVAKARSSYSCTECGARHARWLGRCPTCGAWSTLVEELRGTRAARRPSSSRLRRALAAATKPIALRDVAGGGAPRIATGIAGARSRARRRSRARLGRAARRRTRHRQVDTRLQLAASFMTPRATADGGSRNTGQRRGVLYVTGEESAEQIRLRAERLPALPDGTRGARRDARRGDRRAVARDDARARAGRLDPDAAHRARRVGGGLGRAGARVRGAAGGGCEVDGRRGRADRPRHQGRRARRARACSSTWSTWCCSSRAIAVTRIACCAPCKNRFGSTLEVGVFSMGDAGLEAVENPSELFLAERRAGAPGLVRGAAARRHPADPARGAGAGGAGELRHRASHRDRLRRGAPRAAARGARAARWRRRARERRLSERDRRRAHRGARGGSRRRAGDRVEPARPAAARRTPRRSAKSGSAARCGASRGSSRACAKPRDSASVASWFRKASAAREAEWRAPRPGRRHRRRSRLAARFERPLEPPL